MHKEIQLTRWKYLDCEYAAANADDRAPLERLADKLEREGFTVQIEIASKDSVSFLSLTGQKSLITDATEV